MKQKMIYIVLLVAGIYLPVSSKECGTVCVCAYTETRVQVPVKEKPSVTAEDITSFPASPLTGTPFTL